ncbi:unnamed protein product [Polarella glacialis]|uniref:Class I SAM-dependent methyltransferase n=1 Tax=Polarella glacialis TaxID=89957 RepID=A0A813F5P9_POLGL|nr:unnamed protein product [Polarella glacialis]
MDVAFADVTFLHGFNFNCTHIAADLSGSPFGRPLAALCQEHTIASRGLMAAVTRGCTPQRGTLADGFKKPCAREAECSSRLIRRHLHLLQGRLRQKASAAARRASQAGRWGAEAIQEFATAWQRPWLETECRAWVGDAQLEGSLETEDCQPLLRPLSKCIQEWSDSAALLFARYTTMVSVRESGLEPSWVFVEVLGLGPGSAGEGSPGQPTKRASVLAGLLDTLASADSSPLLMAEIGVSMGSTSVFLLELNPSLRMILVDPYSDFPFHTQLVDGGARDKDKAIASERLEPYLERATQIFKPSVEAAKEVPNESLDLVFIDGEHSYKECREDIKAWAPKVRAGGVLAGHDYTLKFPGVVRAVNEFAIRFVLLLHVDGEDWWVILPAALGKL